MICTKDKLLTCRSIRRLPVEQRWGPENLKWVCWAPWHRFRGDELADGEVPEGVPEVDVPSKEPVVREEGPIIIQTREKAPREFYISKEDCEKHGYTKGCPGCSSLKFGWARQPHKNECRERFRSLLKDEAKVKNQEARKREFENKVIEKSMRKAEKKEEKRKGSARKRKK